MVDTTLQNNVISFKKYFKKRKKSIENTIDKINTEAKIGNTLPHINIKYRFDCKYRKL